MLVALEPANLSSIMPKNIIVNTTAMVQCVASVEKVSAHLSTHSIIKFELKHVAYKDSKYNNITG